MASEMVERRRSLVNGAEVKPDVVGIVDVTSVDQQCDKRACCVQDGSSRASTVVVVLEDMREVDNKV